VVWLRCAVVAARQFGVLMDTYGLGCRWRTVAVTVLRRERAMAGDGTENWRLILEAARALTAVGQSPFTRVSVYEWIWRRYPRGVHDRPSLDPVFQGMVRNAPGGPASSAGTPLSRVGRGQYVLAGAATVPGGAAAGLGPLPPMPAAVRAGLCSWPKTRLSRARRSIARQPGTH